ncbi:alpha/beta fold hydrolase [Streptomyces sp. SPB4]|uniref:alpha/beta fold hydrolase n=1 Tax=Streptomyces sp. SPB4 TaxID=2940553 RepID=UPI002475B22C|nr:alpha/beta fold hydrolase [Streptomyces sp. SPB4]
MELPRPPFLPASGAVLVLHGGRADSLTPPPLLNLPGLRMKPFARALDQDPLFADVLIASVRYRMRGWNGSRADPVQDTRSALEELRHVAGPLPVALIGHSMGARAALRAADDPQVRGVVALAPWCPPGEPVVHLAGRTIMALHDEADRITSATDTWNYLARARAAQARVRGIRMPRGHHAMIRDARLWHRLTTACAATVLGLAPPPGDGRSDAAAWSTEPVDAADITPPTRRLPG